MSSLLAVARHRQFWPLFATQFLGAFNDNVFKQSLILLLTYDAARWSSLPAGLLPNLCAGLFILPFFLFSGLAGQWADRHEKAGIARLVKLMEIALMICALLGYLLHSLPLLLLTLFGMGTHSTLFGPVKYAWLPERLPPETLLAANALVETGTSLAILLGSLFGGVLVTLYGGDPLILGGALIALALLGWLFSLCLPRGQAALPGLVMDWHIGRSTRASLATLRVAPQRWRLALGISWFWLFGAIWLTQLPQYTAHYLGGDAGVATALLVIFSVGVGAGSLLCHTLARWLRPGTLVLLGGGLMAVIGVILPFQAHTGELLALRAWLAQPGSAYALATLTLIGAASGLYIVPLYAQIQASAGIGERARVIAGINVLNALFMVASALAALVWLGIAQASLHSLLIALAVATGVTTWRWRLRDTPAQA